MHVGLYVAPEAIYAEYEGSTKLGLWLWLFSSLRNMLWMLFWS